MSRHVLTWVVVLLATAAARAEPPDGAKSANEPRRNSTLPAADWEIVFEQEITPEEYARQLEFFKIEIAAISKDGRVEYISKLTRPRPEKRVGTTATEYRVFIRWRKGTLVAADRRLLTRAGIASDKKELVHYFPVEVQAQLAELERSYTDRDPREIRRTRFALRPKPAGSGYEFVVIEQEPPPRKPQPSTKSPSLNQPTGP